MFGGGRTSTWMTATSSDPPVGSEKGSAIGARTRATARTTSRAGRTHVLALPLIAANSRAFAITTTNVIPQTPASVASGRTARSSTCEIPMLPQVNPPSGNMPRIQSTAVHKAANPIADRTGRSSRSIDGAMAPTTAIEAAESAVSANHASAPNRKIQYRVAPKNANPKTSPRSGSSSGTGSAQRPEQWDQRHERERPQLRGREGERKQQSARNVEGERGRERDGRRAAQAQSRQSILRLSASWLRCFTR